jgi:hypothetical protein
VIPPAFRNLALTAHITASVGWLGAIAGFLALAISAQTSHDPQTVRASVIAMESIARVVILPLSLASLLTGLVQSLGTKWGLFRHYWVVGKLVINIFANVVLLVYCQPSAICVTWRSSQTRPVGIWNYCGIRLPCSIRAQRWFCCSSPPCLRCTSRVG